MSWQSRLAVGITLGSFALSACSNSTGTGALPKCGANGIQVSLTAGQYGAFDPSADSGCVIFAANTNPDTAEYLVLPWSDGGDASSATPTAPFRLQTASGVMAALMAQQIPAAGQAPRFGMFGGGAQSARGPQAAAFDGFLRQLGRTARLHTARSAAALSGVANAVLAPPTVGDKRTFVVCADAQLCAKFDTVGAVARSVGTHIAIYIDTLAPSPGLTQTDLDSLKGVFDARLYPLDTATFGGVSDIDGNGVVIVLMTNTVNKLTKRADCTASGGAFIAGFFYPPDLAGDPRFPNNNGEIFYSVVSDSLGTLSCAHKPSDVNTITPVIFTHEFQHMINFAQHVLVRGGTNTEEGWLDEGLSKYAEEIGGRSFLADGDSAEFVYFAFDDVADAYTYLSRTDTAALMIPEDNGSLANIGACWLFTRFIVDRFGAALPGKLVRTTLTGPQNIATQTGQTFDSTVTQWSLANWVASFDATTRSAFPSQLKYTSWDFRHTFDTLFVQAPQEFARPYPLVPTVAADNAVNVSGTLKGGSGAYVRVLQPPNGAAFTLHFADPSGAAVGPTVVPRLNILRVR